MFSNTTTLKAEISYLGLTKSNMFILLKYRVVTCQIFINLIMTLLSEKASDLSGLDTSHLFVSLFVFEIHIKYEFTKISHARNYKLKHMCVMYSFILIHFYIKK